jgi:hypothetical protein
VKKAIGHVNNLEPSLKILSKVTNLKADEENGYENMAYVLFEEGRKGQTF